MYQMTIRLQTIYDKYKQHYLQPIVLEEKLEKECVSEDIIIEMITYIRWNMSGSLSISNKEYENAKHTLYEFGYLNLE